MMSSTWLSDEQSAQLLHAFFGGGYDRDERREHLESVVHNIRATVLILLAKVILPNACNCHATRHFPVKGRVQHAV